MWCAVALLAGCAAGASRSPAAGDPTGASPVIDGHWQYRAAVPAGRTALELDLWQPAGGDSITGRVTYWMSGDMGLPADRFGPLAGAIQGPQVWFAIPLPVPAPPLRFDGTLQGDTLLITGSSQGGDPGPFPAGGRFLRVGKVTGS